MKRPNGGKRKHLSEDEKLFKEFLKIEEGDELWDDWKNTDAEHGFLNEVVSEQIIEFVTKNVGKPEKMNISFGFMAAASIAILMMITGVLYLSRFDKQKALVKQITVKDIIEQKDIQIVERKNDGAKEMRLLLPDSSIVLLYQKSSISYEANRLKSSDTSTRGIFLTGSAFFKVAKNPRKPFTVYAGDLSTTALGTAFDVLNNGGNTTVKLYHGKVVVKALKPQKGWVKNVYLFPGEMVALNNAEPQKIQRVTPVMVARNKSSLANKYTEKVKKELLPLQCDNMPMEEVLGALEQYYHVNISYTPELLKDKYFSGEILPEKSPDLILRIICNMQNMHADKTDSGYIIYK